MWIAVQAYGNSCVVLPCCVIGEPAAPPSGQDWFSWLAGYGLGLGLTVDYFYLNFSGQNVGLCVRGGPSRGASGPGTFAGSAGEGFGGRWSLRVW